MLHHGLILTSLREYAQAMRQELLVLGDASTRVDVELDALRAMQLVPQQYDMILLDIMLDAMDGLQLLLLLKQQAPATKFIVVSDAADEISRAHAYQNGADFFLERPRTLEAFHVAVQAIKGLINRQIHIPPRRTTPDTPLANITDVVQTHCLSGDSVLLLVRSRHHSGDVFIFRGEVYHAQFPGKSGEIAFLDMMRWDEGQLQVKTLKLPNVPPRTIETPYRQLLSRVQESVALDSPVLPVSGELLSMATQSPSENAVPSVVLEAPPLRDTSEVPLPDSARVTDALPMGETALPPLNSHWKVNLMGELVEGSQVAESARCAFITYFIYRKMADVAVALEVDYFANLTLVGPHLQQVLVADNLGVRHGVFETAWTSEEKRLQYIKWCGEQSF